jgi:hypothetical protein
MRLSPRWRAPGAPPHPSPGARPCCVDSLCPREDNPPPMAAPPRRELGELVVWGAAATVLWIGTRQRCEDRWAGRHEGSCGLRLGSGSSGNRRPNHSRACCLHELAAGWGVAQTANRTSGANCSQDRLDLTTAARPGPCVPARRDPLPHRCRLLPPGVESVAPLSISPPIGRRVNVVAVVAWANRAIG